MEELAKWKRGRESDPGSRKGVCKSAEAGKRLAEGPEKAESEE